jgi:hypothetical protein
MSVIGKLSAHIGMRSAHDGKLLARGFEVSLWECNAFVGRYCFRWSITNVDIH